RHPEMLAANFGPGVFRHLPRGSLQGGKQGRDGIDHSSPVNANGHTSSTFFRRGGLGDSPVPSSSYRFDHIQAIKKKAVVAQERQTVPGLCKCTLKAALEHREKLPIRLHNKHSVYVAKDFASNGRDVVLSSLRHLGRGARITVDRIIVKLL